MLRCAVAECQSPVIARGVCNRHYKRLRKYGTTAPQRSEYGYLAPDGYRYVTVDGEKVLEHRAVMARVLGRPLRSDEHVHHRDGDKLHNVPENLVLTTASDHRRLHVKYYRDATHKECASCRQILPRDQFPPQKARPTRPNDDPSASRCRPCWSRYVIEHRNQYRSARVASVARNA